jgi:hypothetical protein
MVVAPSGIDQTNALFANARVVSVGPDFECSVVHMREDSTATIWRFVLFGKYTCVAVTGSFAVSVWGTPGFASCHLVSEGGEVIGTSSRPIRAGALPPLGFRSRRRK